MKRFLAVLALLFSWQSAAVAQISPPFRIENQGSLLPLAYTANFTGPGVTCSYGSPPALITCSIPGAGGGGINVTSPIGGDGSAGTPLSCPTCVVNSRQVIAGTGLSGGGALSSNVTLSMPNVGPGAGTIGASPNFIQTVTLDAQGRVSSATTAGITVGTTLSGDGSLGSPIIISNTGPGAGTIGGAPNFVQSITLNAQGQVTAAVAAAVSSGGGFWYGDGTDGAAAFDGSTTPAGSVKNSPTSYTITRDDQYTTCSISNGVSVNENGFRVFCNVSFTATGTGNLNANGNPGIAGSAGGNVVGGTLCGGAGGNCGVVGGAGGTNGGAGGTSAGQTVAGFGGQGGTGGAAGTGGAGGGAGTVTGPTNTTTMSIHDCKMIHGGYLWNGSTTTWVPAKGGTGGGGGGSTAAGSIGGGGGSGAGIVWLASPSITNVSGGIAAIGGTGANGSGTGTGGGGGGGGGGLIVIFYNSGGLSGHTPTAAADAPGGTPGSGIGGTGHNGNTGSNGATPIICVN